MNYKRSRIDVIGQNGNTGEHYSPCIKQCKLTNGVCTGCDRTIEEIKSWPSLTDVERFRILFKLTGNYHYAIDAEEARRGKKYTTTD